MTLKSLTSLAEIRKSQERKPELVTDIGEYLLSSGALGTTEDAWLAYEQICVAACDTGKIQLAKICVEELEKKFPGSLRVLRLNGMILEASKDLPGAEAIYNKILETEPNNIVRDMEKYVKELNKYIDTYYNDPEAWLELCNTYLTLQMYPQAAFCAEELLVQQPHNHFFHLKYAEIQYTIGNIELALQEYLRVVELATDYIRGFYGIKLCADRLLNEIDAGKKSTKGTNSSGKSSKNTFDKATLEKLVQLAANRLLVVYYNRSSDDDDVDSATPMSKTVLEKWLKNMS
ncbi:tetratricopeptide repeat domain-containing protein [Mycoemilia scoparia]|uniref:ER membrane protein complex subunit 2 n=1 Tax=Mycoemilia scoparia TaxID=417184 RepID=A0A9W8A5X7_9FUNG|nr:tetratricopeptide repeat domain-containing protein [Mycoemilia scoparia]